MTDRSVVRLVIGFLGAVGFTLAASLAYVAIRGVEVNEAVLTLLGGQIGATIGALGSMLVHTGSTPPTEAVTTTVEGEEG